MTDHDQRFKVLLQEFLADFFRLFFPEWAARFDFSRIEWLTQELFADPPQGQRRAVDLVARVLVLEAVRAQRPGEPDSEIVLIHLEVESGDSLVVFRGRMYDYYKLLRERYRLPVVPVALYLNVALDGIGWDKYEEFLWGRRVLLFEYLYVGLPGLEAEQYVNQDNPLGAALAALMRLEPERRAWLKAEALRHIEAAADNNWRKYLLGECVDAYLPLDPPQEQMFEQFLDSEPYRGVKPMMTSWEKKGMERAQRETLLFQLEKRFGPLSPEAKDRVQQLPAAQLGDLLLAFVEAQSLQELGLEE